MGIYKKLLCIQTELKAPKSQYNLFGKYNYRNAEDILEAVKPIQAKYNAVTLLSDEIKVIGGRYYVEATATLVDCESGEMIYVKASAREEEDKKGMDGSQVTGASSSYARKYALNGLFAIDDTKDSDTTNDGNKNAKKPVKESQSKPPKPFDGDSEEPKPEKPFDTERTEPEMTLEEAENTGFTSKGVEYRMGDLPYATLKLLAGYTKMPNIAKAAKIVLESRKDDEGKDN